MQDLNEKIQKLKADGMSLRAIAAQLGISHEAVRKRLNRIRSEEKELIAVGGELTQARKVNAISRSGSTAHKSKAFGRARHVVNQMSTSIPPSPNPADAVNLSQTASGKLTGSKIAVTPRVSTETDDPFATIQGFLESLGIMIYPMQCDPEAYQVKHNDQIIRFYVYRS